MLAGPHQGVGGQDYGPQDYFYDVEGVIAGGHRTSAVFWPLALQVNPELTPDE